MRPTRKLDERAEQGAAQRNLNGEHHQDEQDSKVKFDTKHEGADAASGVNPSEGEAQAVKPDVRRAERREDESRREAQNIAVRRCRSTKPVQMQVHGQDRRAQPQMDSGAMQQWKCWIQQHRLASGKHGGEATTPPEAKEHRQRQRHHTRSRASASVEISEGRFPREGPSESHNGQSQSLKPEQ